MSARVEEALRAARAELEEEMASERASAEVLEALAHVQHARHALERRDARVAGEEERARLDAEAEEQRASELAGADPD